VHAGAEANEHKFGDTQRIMSAETNVETAHRFTDAVNRGDYEAAAAELTDDFEVDDTDIPESTGTDSFYEWLRRWDEAWDSWRIEDLEIRRVGEGRTLSLFKMVARGKGSGVELARLDAVVSDYREGKIARLGYYNDQAQALKAAEL
jgi:ketosteroid isomerase-like protein